MIEFWILILVLFFAINSLEKAESVQLEETPHKIFDEIFGEGWWDKYKAEEWHKLTLEQNFHHKRPAEPVAKELGLSFMTIYNRKRELGQTATKHKYGHNKQKELQTFDELFVEEWWDKDEAEDLKRPPTIFRQNVHHQIDWQNSPLVQIEPNSTDQNPPLTESDHSENAKNDKEQKEITSTEKRKIIDKFHAMKDEFKLKGQHSEKEWVQIDNRIAKHLKVSRSKIYKWKKELGLSRKVLYEKEERKHLVEKFDQKKAELQRAGFKSSYKNELDETVAKELGITDRTICKWKRELSHHTTPQHKYANIKQRDLMKLYYELKDKNPKISDENIAKGLKIGTRTLLFYLFIQHQGQMSMTYVTYRCEICVCHSKSK